MNQILIIKMKYLTLILVSILIFAVSCSTTTKTQFSNKVINNETNKIGNGNLPFHNRNNKWGWHQVRQIRKEVGG